MGGISAYRQTQKATESPRAGEYRRLGELTAALLHAEENPKDAHAWGEAVLENQQFWSSLRVHMLRANTSLPEQLRLQFLSLCEWVEKESALVAAGHATLESLIAINRQIMDGLKPYTGNLSDDTLSAVH
jgi:flagellar protein FlaF